MESAETELARIGRAIRQALEAGPKGAEEMQATRERLIERVAVCNELKAARRTWLRPMLSRPQNLLALAAAVGLGTAVWIWMRAPISFQVGTASSTGRLGDVVEAPGSDSVPLRFSEGSSLVLEAGGRARVLSADPVGARVLLESGTMQVSIAHGEFRPARWSLEAGPFHVMVKGTKFQLVWNPVSQSLGLSTKEGAVVVSGGCLQVPRVVGAGNATEFSCAPRAPAILRKPSSLSSTSATPPDKPGASGGFAVPPTTDGSNAIRWRALLAAGRMADAFRAAERAGFARECWAAGEQELVSLADAARLSGHPAQAAEALSILRRRFPRSAESAIAAFSLGRIAFERRGDYAEAVRWFAAYLNEAPNGPLSGDAVGRLMEARQKQGDRDGARTDAERYLHRFPGGPYADQAKTILLE